METKNLLAIVIVLLLGIFIVMVIQVSEETPEEKIANSVSNVIDNASERLGN